MLANAPGTQRGTSVILHRAHKGPNAIENVFQCSHFCRHILIEKVQKWEVVIGVYVQQRVVDYHSMNVTSLPFLFTSEHLKI